MTSIRNVFVFSVITLGLLCGLAPEANAGCRINYSFENNSTTSVVTFGQFQVKSKGGAWKGVPKTKSQVKKRKGRTEKAISRRYGKTKIKGILAEIGSGEIFSSYFNATFGCKAKRQYRFAVSKGNCTKNIYYPSATGWTKSMNINFGDISRHCR